MRLINSDPERAGGMERRMVEPRDKKSKALYVLVFVFVFAQYRQKGAVA